MSKHRFSELMDDLGLMYDKAVSTAIKRMYWDDLGGMPIDMIEAAMVAHRRNPDCGRFFPKPADLIRQIERARSAGMPSPDEAWAIALRSFDEAETVCVTDEIMEAVAAALPVWDVGDKVGARMAFRSAYERIEANRRAQGAIPKWRLSLGWDADKRAQAAQAAVAAGRLEHRQVSGLLPSPEPDARQLRLPGNVVVLPVSNSVRAEGLQRIRSTLGIAGDDETPRQCADRERRERIDAAREGALKAIEQMQQECADGKG